MLATLGFPSRAALMDAIVPASIRRAKALDLPPPVSETDALSRLKVIAAKNRVLTSMIGQGYYGTITPGVIARNILENPAWYTAYTPYQPEISQGRLEALVNFQTMVCDLTGMAIANASMLDEATAAAEAMTLCQRMSKSRSSCFFVADDVFAQTLDVVRTRALPLGIEIVTGPVENAAAAGAFAVLLQYPGADGEVRDLRAIVTAVHAAGGFAIAAADILALTLLAPPGEWGADVVVGSTQRFGVPMGFGGPHAGYPRDARRIQAVDAGPSRRRHHRCRRRARLPACVADARAAHPAREGDVQHLHSAGAAGRDGEHVRGLPRPVGPDPDRASRAPARGDPEGRPRARGLQGPHDGVLRHDHRRDGDAHRRASRARRRRRHQFSSCRRRDTRSHARRNDDPRRCRARVAGILERGAHRHGRGARRNGDGRTARCPGPHERIPHAPDVQPLSLRDGDAALFAAPRRSRHRARPGDDSARIVHDEAERDGRDDSGHLAGVRVHAPVRSRRPGRRVMPSLPPISSECCAR